MINLSKLFNMVGKDGFSELNVHRDGTDRWFFSATRRKKSGGSTHWYSFCQTEEELVVLVLKGLKEDLNGQLDYTAKSKGNKKQSVSTTDVKIDEEFF